MRVLITLATFTIFMLFYMKEHEGSLEALIAIIAFTNLSLLWVIRGEQIKELDKVNKIYNNLDKLEKLNKIFDKLDKLDTLDKLGDKLDKSKEPTFSEADLTRAIRGWSRKSD